jgi:hypothetical protein
VSDKPMVPGRAWDAARWRGKTRQGRLALVVTGSDGLVSKVRIRYRAMCSDGKRLTSGVIFLPPLDTSTATAFTDRGVFRFRLPDGERARARTSVEGGLRRSGRWTGNFRIRVRITRKGRLVAGGASGWRHASDPGPFGPGSGCFVECQRSHLLPGDEGNVCSVQRGACHVGATSASRSPRGCGRRTNDAPKPAGAIDDMARKC